MVCCARNLKSFWHMVAGFDPSGLKCYYLQHHIKQKSCHCIMFHRLIEYGLCYLTHQLNCFIILIWIVHLLTLAANALDNIWNIVLIANISSDTNITQKSISKLTDLTIMMYRHVVTFCYRTHY